MTIFGVISSILVRLYVMYEKKKEITEEQGVGKYISEGLIYFHI